MDTEFQQPKDLEGAISALNAAINTLDPAKSSCIAPAKTVLGSVSVLLVTIRVCFLLCRNDLLWIHTWLGLDG